MARRSRDWHCKSCGKEITTQDVRVMGRGRELEMETLCCADWIVDSDGADVDERDFIDALDGPFDERD